MRRRSRRRSPAPLSCPFRAELSKSTDREAVIVNKRLRFATARQVFEAFPTASSDIEAKPSDTEPLAFLQSLLRGPTPEDAVSFCAYLLPRREAVWWACRCIRALEQPLGEADEKLLA